VLYGRGQECARVEDLIALLRHEGANLAVTSAAKAVEEGLERLEQRGVLVVDGNRVRVRDRLVLRFYARGIQHLVGRPGTTH